MNESISAIIVMHFDEKHNILTINFNGHPNKHKVYRDSINALVL